MLYKHETEGWPPVLATVYARVKLRMLVRMYAWLALFGLRNIQTLCLLLTNLEMCLKEREINNSLQAEVVCCHNIPSEITIIVNGYMCILWVPADIYICNVWLYFTSKPSYL